LKYSISFDNQSISVFVFETFKYIFNGVLRSMDIPILETTGKDQATEDTVYQNVDLDIDLKNIILKIRDTHDKPKLFFEAFKGRISKKKKDYDSLRILSNNLWDSFEKKANDKSLAELNDILGSNNNDSCFGQKDAMLASLLKTEKQKTKLLADEAAKAIKKLDTHLTETEKTVAEIKLVDEKLRKAMERECISTSE